MNRVFEVGIPSDSNISLYNGSVDLADAYMVELQKGSITNPELLARFIFEQQAPWVMGLMSMRDMFVKVFGLKISTVEDLQRHDIEGMKRVGFFRVYGLLGNEIIMGENDHHLDFRVSVLYRNAEEAGGNTPHVIVSTIVLCHNVLGRNYIKLIAPFHKLVVKSGLKRAIKKGFPKEV
jgi:hypothetical protein